MRRLGKEFEQRFRDDWLNTFPESFIFRLKDDVSQYKTTAANPCDFICFNSPLLYLIEVKTVQHNTFPFSNLTQYESLLTYTPIKNCIVGVVIWYVIWDKVIFVPVTTIKKLKEAGKKSINITKDLDKFPEIIEIPSEKKRVFMKSNYSVLYNSSIGG